jgi:DNA polymerase-4
VDFTAEGDLRREVSRVAGYAWQRIERAQVRGRTVTLKVKYADFTLITRSKSFASTVPDFDAFETAGQSLLGQILPVPKGIRLLGLGLHSLIEEDDSTPRQLGLAI